MEQYAAGTISKQGSEYPIYVNDSGRWLAYPGGVDDRPISADSRDNLAKALTAALRKQRVVLDVPFTWAKDRGGIKSGTVTGRNVGNGKFLVTWEDGSKSQITQYGNGGPILGHLDGDQIARWGTLRQALRDAENALRDFEHDHRIALDKATDAAIAEARAKQGGESA